MSHEEPLESKTDEAMEATPAGRAPWGWGTLLIVSLLGGLGAAGIIAGLNWRRMGFYRLMWPTIIISIIIFFILTVAISATTSNLLVNIVSLAAVWGLVLWQRPYYQIWKQINPEAQRAGWQIPMVTVIVPLAVSVGGIFLM